MAMPPTATSPFALGRKVTGAAMATPWPAVLLIVMIHEPGHLDRGAGSLGSLRETVAVQLET